MNATVRQIIQLTFFAVIGYLIVTHRRGDVAILGSVSKLYNSGVRTLQGR